MQPFAAVALHPDHPRRLAEAGIALAQSGDAPAGAAWLGRSAILASSDASVAEALAAALLRSGSHRQARPWIGRAIAAGPAHAPRHLAMARVDFALARQDACWRRLGRAAALAPQAGEVWRLDSAIARDAGLLARALRSARVAALLDPGDADALVGLAHGLHALGDGREAEGFLLRALSIGERADIANLLVVVRTYCATLAALARAVERGRQRPSQQRRPRPAAGPPTRHLRIGYVSADLREHPVGRALIGLIEAADRDKFQISCYSGIAEPDRLTRRAMASAARYRATLGLSDERLARVIRSDGIDILVHVAGRFTGNRPLLARQQAAPVQLAMHDLTSTGEDLIDGWLSDDDLHPARSTEHFVEPVLRLPCFYLFEAPPEVDPGPVPARRNGYVTFGSANNPSKWTPATLALWARLLAETGRSRLWLKFHSRTADPATRRCLADRLQRHGIPIERVDFDDGETDRAAHLAALAKVDIALDPLPFGGSTAAFEALWMGIPYVALRGDRTVGRTGAALLTRLGLPDLIATDADGYVGAASGLAREPGRLDALRASLRSRLLASALFDRAAYVRSVEDLYRTVWLSARVKN